MRKLDLLDQFTVAARLLLLEADRGRLVHRTGNVAGSGIPLEKAVRKFLSNRIPTPFSVRDGYAVDSGAICSEQIDVIIADATDTFWMMGNEDQPDQDQAYVFYSGIRAIGEIKNSAYDLAKSVEQITDRLSSIKQMATRSIRSGNSPQQTKDQPISFVLIANTQDLRFDDLKDCFAGMNMPPPHFVVLLDRGILISGKFELFDFDHPDFHGSLNTGRPWVSVANSSSEKSSGIVLLWLYAAILRHLLFSRGNQGNIPEFINSVHRDYKLEFIDAVDNLSSWDFDNA